jgi:ABC-type dipeptide/oligopeptide/nickel transport system permease subunit
LGLSSVGVDVDREAAENLFGTGGDQRGDVVARTPLELFWRRFKEDRLALAALGVIFVLVLVAIFAPQICKLVGVPGPNTPDKSTLDSFGLPTGPSKEHPFGVDDIGRDVFARTLYGARVSLFVAIVATALSVTVGVIAGMVAGFYRGWVDTAISRSVDVLLAFPILLLAIGVASACSFGRGASSGCLGGALKPGIGLVILVIAFVNWTYIARIIRGQVLSMREKEFVEAARSLGASNRRIIFREILPNLVAPIIVYSTLIIPQNILFEAALSFLGVGVQPPQASWGKMIAEAQGSFDTAWWFMLFPGLALLVTVLAFNLVGDGLSDALNPRSDR